MLTDAQKLDVRRWMGYPTLNAGYPDTVYTVAWNRSYFPVSITQKLANLTAAEEAALVGRYLGPLAGLEAAFLGSSDNMDTESAGPWTANKTEASDRSRLYDQWRRDMASFLGFAPGPALGSGGGVVLARC